MSAATTYLTAWCVATDEPAPSIRLKGREIELKFHVVDLLSQHTRQRATIQQMRAEINSHKAEVNPMNKTTTTPPLDATTVELCHRCSAGYRAARLQSVRDSESTPNPTDSPPAELPSSEEYNRRNTPTLRKILQILASDCEMDPIQHRDGVASLLASDRGEYRFMGALGSGGKLYKARDRLTVSCYSEDRDENRKAIIEATNAALAVLELDDDD